MGYMVKDEPMRTKYCVSFRRPLKNSLCGTQIRMEFDTEKDRTFYLHRLAMRQYYDSVKIFLYEFEYNTVRAHMSTDMKTAELTLGEIRAKFNIDWR